LQHPEALLTAVDAEEDELEQLYANLQQQDNLNHQKNVVNNTTNVILEVSQQKNSIMEGDKDNSTASIVPVIGTNSSTSNVSITATELTNKDKIENENRQKILLASLADQIGGLDYEEDEDIEVEEDIDNEDVEAITTTQMIDNEVSYDNGTEERSEIMKAQLANMEISDDSDDDAWMKDL